jgi:hypothetical protein
MKAWNVDVAIVSPDIKSLYNNRHWDFRSNNRKEILWTIDVDYYRNIIFNSNGKQVGRESKRRRIPIRKSIVFRKGQRIFFFKDDDIHFLLDVIRCTHTIDLFRFPKVILFEEVWHMDEFLLEIWKNIPGDYMFWSIGTSYL